MMCREEKNNYLKNTEAATGGEEPEVFCSKKLRKLRRKTPVLESFFKFLIRGSKYKCFP